MPVWICQHAISRRIPKLFQEHFGKKNPVNCTSLVQEATFYFTFMQINPMKPFISNMFRMHKTQDVITLFHKPSLSASTRVVTLLKQASAQASETATEDQASDHTHQNQGVQREPFELDITEAPPTSDQLSNILDYVGQGKVGQLVKGAASPSDALKKLKENPDAFQRPVVVDWNQGKAIIGENESEILKLLREAPKSS